MILDQHTVSNKESVHLSGPVKFGMDTTEGLNKRVSVETVQVSNGEADEDNDSQKEMIKDINEFMKNNIGEQF